MRTTLDITEDVLLAAKDLARREKSSVGEVLSRLARQALLAPAAGEVPPVAANAQRERLARLGIHPLTHRGGVVSNELVNRIRDEEGI
jgi:hypothetical protein